MDFILDIIVLCIIFCLPAIFIRRKHKEPLALITAFLLLAPFSTIALFIYGFIHNTIMGCVHDDIEPIIFATAICLVIDFFILSWKRARYGGPYISKLDLILRDANAVLRNEHYSLSADLSCKSFIKKELAIQFSPIFIDSDCKEPLSANIRTKLEQQIDESCYRIVYSRKTDYIYLLLEYLALNQNNGYELYLYCERRMRHKTEERKYLLNCIESVHDKIEKMKDDNIIYSTIKYSAERIFLLKLFLHEPSGEKDVISKSNMIQTIANAEKEALCVNWDDQRIPGAVKEYSKLLIAEINEQW